MLIPRTLSEFLQRLRGDRRGVSAIEFALLAPVMLVMFFGMVELSMAIMTQRRASHGDAAIGDLVAQYGNPTYISGVAQGTAPVNPAMTPATMNDVFIAGDLIIAPYPTAPYVTRISSIVVDSTGAARINWSCIVSGQASPLSAPLTAAAKITTVPSGMLSTTAGDSLIMSESAYPYTSSLKYFLKGTINFNNTFYFKPRASVTGVGFFPGTSATAWNGTWDSSSVGTALTASGVTCSYQTG
ncbi:MAG: TadE/TadG family type IV pilus assembly protein [Caulobacteraceae bacterium]